MQFLLTTLMFLAISPGKAIRDEGQPVRVVSMPEKDSSDRLMLRTNEGLFIVGFLGVIAAFCTFRNVKNSSERQLRAYLTVGVGGAVYQEREKGTPFGVLPILINTGQTPAYEVKWVIKAAVLPKELPANYALSEVGEDCGKTTIANSQRVNMHARADGFQPDDEVADIKSHARDKALYVWGLVRYVDAFRNKRYTRFCHRVLWLPEGNEIYGYFVPERNDAD
jgi:hypothetical protein